MRALSVLTVAGLFVACSSGCSLFRSSPMPADADFVSPGAIAELTAQPIVFGAGDALGRALHLKRTAHVRAMTTPREQLTTVIINGGPLD